MYKKKNINAFHHFECRHKLKETIARKYGKQKKKLKKEIIKIHKSSAFKVQRKNHKKKNEQLSSKQ